MNTKELSTANANNWLRRASDWKRKCVAWMVNHGIEPVKNWWKPRTFALLPVPEWMKELLNNTQAILLALQQKDRRTHAAAAKHSGTLFI